MYPQHWLSTIHHHTLKHHKGRALFMKGVHYFDEITEGKVALSNLKHLTNLSYPKHWTPFTPHWPENAFSQQWTIESQLPVCTDLVIWVLKYMHVYSLDLQFFAVLQKWIYTVINTIIWNYFVVDICWLISPVSRILIFCKWPDQCTQVVVTQLSIVDWMHSLVNAVWRASNVWGKTGLLGALN